MPKEQRKEASIMRQVLENNAGHRAPFIKAASDSLPDDDKASDQAVFEQTREAIVAEVRGKPGERLANSIADALKLKHIKEYRKSQPQEKKRPRRKPPPSKIKRRRAQ